ncbi:MAG TPA: helix-turn-helix transcriptional regulator [Ideonella sp.]|uniref:helix-turn-helix domain-containing protein n=1 Tax=Ideonella sp. TaxID=1929293 RepID=UPI002E2F9032|nr:helix-turn-helix transcriptional regulator [Ideonella sp.]HEX5684863.1 helix-turn-helix transcriptional regulator [Ideonella sp.]
MTKAPTDQESDPLAQQIGSELASARREKGLSVSELHRTTGISRTVLQGYEAGRYKPGARELRLLSEALDCSPNRLLFGHDEFRKRTSVDELLGDQNSAIRAARFAIVFQLLTNEEQRAVLSLLSLLVEGRAGGREQLAKQLSVVDAVVANLETRGPAAEEDLLRVAGGDDTLRKLLDPSAIAPPPPEPRKKKRDG